MNIKTVSQRLDDPGVVPQPTPIPRSKINRVAARLLGSLAGAAALLLAALPAQSATVTYDFSGSSLQGWHNRVWDIDANGGAGAWIDLAPNTTDTYPIVLQPPSGDNGVFGNNGTQVDPVGGNNDNHQNTLWLRSPAFTLDNSGNLTVQLARGRAHGPAPANEAAVSYIADGTTGWKGVALRRVSDGAFVLAKPRTTEGDAMVTVTFTASELTPYVGTVCTLELINAERGGWGWLSMDNVSIPGTLLPPAKLTATVPSLTVGATTTVVASIPAGANASSPVTVYVTNGNPAAITINGSAAAVTTLTFATGGPITQNLTVAGVALGFASLTTGSATLLSDSVSLSVLPASGLIGRWLSGTEDLLDKSGYTPAGTHDGMMSDGFTAVFSADVPPGVTGSSLDLAASAGAILITNSSKADAGYRATFDEGTAQQLTVAFWAKGLPGSWNPFVSKYGEGAQGWQVRRRTDSSVATFTVRGTAGEDDPYNSSSLINDGNWHHFTATYDAATGTRKLYVDGQLSLTVGHDSGPMAVARFSYLTLGGRSAAGATSPGNTFFGNLYDVRVYGLALSGSAVKNLFAGTATSLAAVAETPVTEIGKTATVSVSIPAAANVAVPVTVFVTNTTPAIASLSGAVANVLTLTFPVGAASSQNVTLTGLTAGQAQLTVAATGLTAASATVTINAQRLVGQWFTGAENYTDASGFAAPGTHDGTEIGNVGTLTFVSDTPPSKPGKSAQFGGGVALGINNSSRLDAGYAPTFDDGIARQFTLAFWAKGIPGTWNPFISKRGEDAIGWQMRRGPNLTEAFTIRGTGSGNEDGVGSVAINDGQWHHFAAVWDGVSGTRKCYIDGVLDPSVNLTNDFTPMTLAANHRLVLGGRDPAAVNGTGIEGTYSGLMYDVRMYNYPLTDPEVKTLSFIAALKVAAAQPSLPAPQSMTVDITIPAGANQSQAVSVKVTNNTPAIASLSGAVGNVVTLNFAIGAPVTQQVTVTGIADGRARLTATGGGFTAGSGSFNVWADPGTRLIGRWLNGSPDLLESSGFRPAGTHNGVAVGDNAVALAFSTDVPPVAPQGAQSLDLTVGGVAVMITNSSSAELGYVETFDNQMANKFSITFWAKGGTPVSEDWNAWISKRGEDNLGYQVRRNGGSNPVRPTFTIRGTAGADDPASANGFATEEWHHYAATWDGTSGDRTLYVDGVQVVGVSGDFGPFAMSTGDHLVLGGLESGSLRRFYPSLLYDVRIYSYALSQAAVGVMVNPPTAFTITVAHDNIPQGDTLPLVITLPASATASSAVTVYLTNNSPSVVSIVGPTAITFPIGSMVQTVNLLTIGPGQINITAGAVGQGSASLATVNNVIPRKLIGHWFDGTASLADKSGFTANGRHDAMVVGNNPETLAYSADVPPGFSGQSLDLTANATGTVGVVVSNSAAADEGYLPTFDGGISSAFTVAVWAKGVPGTWAGFIAKRGEDGIGWQMRRSGGDTEAFTIRGTSSGNADGVGSVSVTDGQWHHYVGVWDGVTGIRKCYVDGILDPSVNLTGDFAPMSLAPNHHLGIGARETGGTGAYEAWFNGKLYDVRMYNYAITPSEVAALVTAAPSAPTLKIQVWTGNQVRLSWPTSFTGYTLQKSATVPAGWGVAGLTVTVEGAENVAYTTTAGLPQFFRLTK